MVSMSLENLKESEIVRYLVLSLRYQIAVGLYLLSILPAGVDSKYPIGQCSMFTKALLWSM